MGRILLAITLALSSAFAVPTQALAKTDKTLYIVQLAGQPALRTESARAAVRTNRAAVLRKAGIAKTVTDYETVFNGFAAALTPAQKARVERTPGVLRLWKNERRTVDTISTPAFLGLAGADGAWAQQFGDPAHAGEGVIIADIDTGFWPESPSLAALPEPRPDQATIDRKWFADGADKCDEGTGTPQQQVTCNNKVIGARYYNSSGFGDWDSEFRSPRDYDGHGTHTATTAAGLNDVLATINGGLVGKVSGMAPAARIAVYKALWRQADGEGSGGTTDLLKAVDDAVSDGVDVINYSVSGSSALLADPIELAFFNAAAAGVFVAASALMTTAGELDNSSGPIQRSSADATPFDYGSGTGAAGHGTVDLRGGYTGTVTAHGYGLAASTVHEQKLIGSTAAFVPAAPGVAPSIFSFEFTMPAATKIARLSTFAADHAPGTDLDLYAYQDGKLVGRSDGTTADEELSLTSPGTYQVYVVQFGLPPTLTEQVARAHLFMVPSATTGNLTITPTSRPVTPDEMLSFDVAWHGLDPKQRYLGMVEFGDLTAARAWTTVVVGPQPATIP